MALLMVMTVCLLVYAALEYRIRTALFYYFVGIHVLFIPGQSYIVMNLTEEHLHLLQLLGKRYA